MEEKKQEPKPQEKKINLYDFLEKNKIEGFVKKAYLKKYQNEVRKSKTLREWNRLIKLS